MSDPASEDDAALDTTLTKTVEAWLADNWDPATSAVEWWQRVADARWTAPHFPREWGGLGYPRRSQHVARAVFQRYGALLPPGGLGLLMAAPTILTHGTPDQIARHVPSILNGRIAWCQLFSEPGAGSDLAGLRTRATRDGDRWIVSGQKVWSSQARECDYGMLLARTAIDRAKHAGISWFAFPLDQPGVTIRPLREATGHAIFNEVFFDDAVVDDADLIGGEGNGWAVTQTTLLFERTGIGAGGSMVGFPYPGQKSGLLDLRAGDAAAVEPPTSGTKVLTFAELVDLAHERGRGGDHTVRQDLARLACYVHIGGWTAQRSRTLAPADAARFANLAKLAQTRIAKFSTKIAIDIVGPAGLLWAHDGPQSGRYSEALVFSTASSIYGGTDEIQRNVIGERALGLPREPDPDRGRPFGGN